MSVKDALKALGMTKIHPELSEKLIQRDYVQTSKEALAEFIVAFWRLGLQYKNEQTRDWKRLVDARRELPAVVMSAASKFEYKDYFQSEREDYEDRGATQLITGLNATELAQRKVNYLKASVKKFFIDGECREEFYDDSEWDMGFHAFIDELIEAGGLQYIDFYDGRLDRSERDAR